jgi:para-aminobenzoate synthetase component 1
MISTVSGDMRDGIHFTDVLKNAFPMGSMTGAPKIQAMELIEQYEKTRRGLYSGAVGYITPPAPLSIFPLVKGGRGIAGSPLVKGNRGDCWSPPYQRGIKWDCRRGSVGEVDFDFNVVIRSILYNSSSKYLSFQVGSAITANSIPEEEYQECLLKAKGMFEALNQDSYFPISILYA